MFNRKYIFNPGPFSIAILVYWSVDIFQILSLKLTANAPDRPKRPKRKGSSSKHPMFRGYLFVLGSVSIQVGGFNPFEKYARQIGSFPQVDGKNLKKCLKPPPGTVMVY